MKLYKYGIMVILTMLILMSGCMRETKKPNINQKNESNSTIKENNKKIVKTYVDDNPIKMGIYFKYNSGRKLITDFYYDWTPLKDIGGGSFSAFPTNDSIISAASFQTVWKQYWNTYTAIENYKIGYFIRFTLTDNREIKQTILGPNESDWFFDYIQIYLYDNINQIPGHFYSHLIKDDMDEKTIITSIKLTSSIKFNEVQSPIELTTFTYNDSEDFDPITKEYRGNSKYTIYIYKTE